MTVPHHPEVLLGFGFDFLPRFIPLLFGSSSSSRLIGEPLAGYPAQKNIGTFSVIYAKGQAVVISEIELG